MPDLLTILYRPVGRQELELIRGVGSLPGLRRGLYSFAASRLSLHAKSKQ